LVSVQRESVEFIPIHVVSPDTIATDTIQYALTTGRDRPTTWSPVISLDGQVGFLTGPHSTPTVYKVWVRIDDNPEIPVLHAGELLIG
jgi:hypothetical protein